MISSNSIFLNLKLFLFVIAITALILVVSIVFSNRETLAASAELDTSEVPQREYQEMEIYSKEANEKKGAEEEVVVEKIEEVETSDIMQLSDLSEANEIHRRLAITLISELELLNETKNRNVIRARLSSTANKFYLLKRAMKAKKIKNSNFLTLSSEYDQRVKSLNEIWTKNPDLANEADDIYSDLNLLDYEHVPYVLRNWLISNSTLKTP